MPQILVKVRELEVGDDCAIVSELHSTSSKVIRVAPVDMVTPTELIVEGHRFRRDTGELCIRTLRDGARFHVRPLSDELRRRAQNETVETPFTEIIRDAQSH